MTQVERHKNQATRNEEFHHLAKDNSYFDWAAVSLFYAALHYIDGYFFLKLKTRPKDHTNRGKMVSQVKDLKNIYGQYRFLFDVSRNIRYDFFRPSKKELEDLYNKEFLAVKNHLLSLY